MSCNHGYSFRYPENCTFICNHGYHLSAGSTSRTCQADRTWSGSAARCMGNEWRQVFATVKGTGQKAVDAWRAGAGASVLHDKSPLVEQWGSLGIKLVKVVLETYGEEDLEMIFNGENTDKYSWFSQSRLLSSPWSDIHTEPKNFFSLAGEVGRKRTFFINRSYNGCPLDFGWLVLAEAGTVCTWELAPPDQQPYILFSRKTTYVNWNNGPNVGEADRMVIYIKKGCPDGYVYYQPNQLCYKAFNQRSNYTSAVATCSSDGGTLAMPRDAGINAFLINLKNAVDDTAKFWFGMTDRVTEGRWVWADGVALSLGHFNRWSPGQPNNAFGNENCAHYWTERGDMWNDLSCSDPTPKFICQVAS
ncbi:uncharacterized protein LOC118421003 [Branchiostoma floridae]|uniref:Uncharacterized protein LOC118421003 n=1 Tax=Branchiostoma floridae TaxID=7739 RepID=A0A9J7LJI7_BRAFL|nr:uncharacterized protein LOC118421003 [Branchiostoma floridae]